MTHPRRFLIRMALFLVVVIVCVGVLHEGLERAFSHNMGLNGLILGILLVGVGMNFRQVFSLGREVRWVEAFRANQPMVSGITPRLLAPLATMLGERRDRFSLSPLALRSLLDGLSARLDEAREISRYFTGLMIFLGLLGTFWGLAQTVGSLADVVRNLTSVGDDVATAFAGLRQGLESPLAGMGTAFSSSLIGLAGSLVLGFLDIQAGQAQNAFYNDLEEWLSGQTRLGSSIGFTEGGEQPIPAYIQALLEQTADSLNNLQRTIARGEESRINANANTRALTDRLSSLAESTKTGQALMLKLAENQVEMKPLLDKLTSNAASAGLDETSRIHLRNIDVALARLVDEMSTGRDEMIREMRSEFKLLARTIAALAEEEAGRPASRPDA